ncbi:hypothetical protein ACJX0J_033253, partial [Zea mays]
MHDCDAVLFSLAYSSSIHTGEFFALQRKYFQFIIWFKRREEFKQRDANHQCAVIFGQDERFWGHMSSLILSSSCSEQETEKSALGIFIV